jgi:hypothetical protein
VEDPGGVDPGHAYDIAEAASVARWQVLAPLTGSVSDVGCSILVHKV